MELTLRGIVTEKKVAIPPVHWDKLVSLITTFDLKKGQHLNSGQDFCHHLWLLKDGAVKAVDQREGMVVDLYLPGNFFTDLASLSLHDRSHLSFVAVKDSHIHQLDYAGLLRAAEKCSFLANVSRMIMEMLAVRETEARRVVNILQARERLTFLYDTSPELFLNFSMKDIAQFIGIAPESLSRLRAGMVPRSS